MGYDPDRRSPRGAGPALLECLPALDGFPLSAVLRPTT